jgi:hypothetical protein
MTWTCPACERDYPDSALGLPARNDADEKRFCTNCALDPAWVKARIDEWQSSKTPENAIPEILDVVASKLSEGRADGEKYSPFEQREVLAMAYQGDILVAKLYTEQAIRYMKETPFVTVMRIETNE